MTLIETAITGYCFKGTKGSCRVTLKGGEKGGHQKGLFIITTLRLRFVYY